jgi:hypothetical protein
MGTIIRDPRSGIPIDVEKINKKAYLFGPSSFGVVPEPAYVIWKPGWTKEKEEEELKAIVGQWKAKVSKGVEDREANRRSNIAKKDGCGLNSDTPKITYLKDWAYIEIGTMVEEPGQGPGVTFGQVGEVLISKQGTPGHEDESVMSALNKIWVCLNTIAVRLRCPKTYLDYIQTEMYRYFEFLKKDVHRFGSLLGSRISLESFCEDEVDPQTKAAWREYENLLALFYSFLPVERDFQLRGLMEFFEIYRYTNRLESNDPAYDATYSAENKIRNIAFNLAKHTRVNNGQREELLEYIRQCIEDCLAYRKGLENETVWDEMSEKWFNDSSYEMRTYQDVLKELEAI